MDKPVFVRKRYDPDDRRIRCWACKDYIACGEYVVSIVRAGTAWKQPVITLCTKCAKAVGDHAMSQDERA